MYRMRINEKLGVTAHVWTQAYARGAMLLQDGVIFGDCIQERVCDFIAPSVDNTIITNSHNLRNYGNLF